MREYGETIVRKSERQSKSSHGTESSANGETEIEVDDVQRLRRSLMIMTIKRPGDGEKALKTVC